MVSESAVQEHHINEFAKCLTSKWYFLTEYVRFFVPGQGVIRVTPLSHQRDLLALMDAHNRLVVLKARQIGVTWTVSAVCIHDTIFSPGANDLIFSRGEKEAAKTLKERCRGIWSNLPPFLQLPIGKDNEEMIEFPDNNSFIRSFASTPGSGVGETATRVVLDEWSKIKPDSYAEQIYIDIEPTVEHGKLIMMSTAEGRAKFFARTYYEAKAGENEFVPVFIPFNVMPGRNAEWVRQTQRKYPGYTFHQNYPSNESDAFLIAGTCMFDIPTLKAMRTREPVQIHHGAEIYEPPVAGHPYFVGVDTALGITGRDYSCAEFLDATTNTQAARLRTQVPLEQFAESLFQVLNFYGQPMCIIEEQPQGRLVVRILQDLGYPQHKIYYRSKNVPCWHTNESSRRMVLGSLEQGIRGEGLKLYNLDTVEEFLGFGYNEEDNKFEALAGHDDEVMAFALAYHLKATTPPPLEDLRPRTYINNVSTKDIVDILDVNWKRKDPFKNQEVAQCPNCAGARQVSNPYTLMSEICRTCHGYGKVLRRLYV